MKLRVLILLFFSLAFFSRAYAIDILPAYDVFGSEKKLSNYGRGLIPIDCPSIPRGRALSLPEVLDVALCNNPATRASWYGLRASAIDLNGTKVGAYVPNTSISASLSKSWNRAGGTGPSMSESTGIAGTASYTLYDFGVKEANIEAAEQGFIAAGHNYDAGLQSQISSILQGYYQQLTTQGALAVSQESEKFAKESLDAAVLRYEIGQVPLSDKLQAQNSYSQAVLSRETAENALLLARAALASLMGLGPKDQVNVLDVDDSVLVQNTLEANVDKLMEAAKIQRLDIKAYQAGLIAQRASLEALKRADLPSISLSAGQNFNDVDLFNRSDRFNNTIGVSVSIPIFSGFVRPYSIKSAEERLKVQELGYERLQIDVVQDVFRAYTNYQTTQANFETTWDFVASATQLRDVALGRYREGLGNILDVLSAQSQYSSALQQQVNTKYNLLQSRADLVRASGALTLSTALPNAPLPVPRDDNGG